MDADFFANSWRVCCFGGFLFGREAVRQFIATQRGGTLLFTSASASCAVALTLALSTHPRERCVIWPKLWQKSMHKTVYMLAMW